MNYQPRQVRSVNATSIGQVTKILPATQTVRDPGFERVTSTLSRGHDRGSLLRRHLLDRVVDEVEGAVTDRSKDGHATVLELVTEDNFEGVVHRGSNRGFRVVLTLVNDRNGSTRDQERSFDGHKRDGIEFRQSISDLSKGVVVGVTDGGLHELDLISREVFVDANHGKFDIRRAGVLSVVNDLLRKTSREGARVLENVKGAVLGLGKNGKARSTQLLADALFEIHVNLSGLGRQKVDFSTPLTTLGIDVTRKVIMTIVACE